jgi:hypothetical protein
LTIESNPVERRFCLKINDYSNQRLVTAAICKSTLLFTAKPTKPIYECLSPINQAMCRVCYINPNIERRK